ncbi:hypothetical protein [Salinispira pacifica]|uniref:Uncharacterized protein n=1 Tax=Salinispira pacifica TaxID=1307761 RepID=V5WFD5_9SPIO|nr:hypothetical protein [Salinispira pacifica]AHC14269.1 hypothetical protein L21SP2_0849 [Salinispira pacifica]
MSKVEKFYAEEADFLLRENMNRLKGLIDLLCLGAMDDMSEEEKEEFLQKIQSNMNSFFDTLEDSILKRKK